MYKFHIDAHERGGGYFGGSHNKATHGGSGGTGQSGEIMHFGFPADGFKNVRSIPQPPSPHICLPFFQKKGRKAITEYFHWRQKKKKKKLKKINAHDGRSCWSKYELVWPLVNWLVISLSEPYLHQHLRLVWTDFHQSWRIYYFGGFLAGIIWRAKSLHRRN